ncbi:hypothetical protein F5Y04DRAFT_247840 [Hypomontagnella monticulosa]|nr:hypothetical protein F5Y04DRAFT_247840 [Hypomontagnella monticulosa]
MPGGKYIDYTKPQSDEALSRRIWIYLEVLSIGVIALQKPWYSSNSALKLCLIWKYSDLSDTPDTTYRDTTWIIRDSSSPMARLAWLYRPDVVEMCFDPCKIHQKQLIAIDTLRTKLSGVASRWSTFIPPWYSSDPFHHTPGHGESFLRICKRMRTRFLKEAKQNFLRAKALRYLEKCRLEGASRLGARPRRHTI